MDDQEFVEQIEEAVNLVRHALAKTDLDIAINALTTVLAECGSRLPLTHEQFFSIARYVMGKMTDTRHSIH